MKTALIYLRVVCSELANLKNPVADVALAGIVIKLLPFVHVNTTTLVSVLAAVGLIAAWGKTQLQHVPQKAAVKKAEKDAAKAEKAPEPVPAVVVAQPDPAPVIVVPDSAVPPAPPAA